MITSLRQSNGFPKTRPMILLTLAAVLVGPVGVCAADRADPTIQPTWLVSEAAGFAEGDRTAGLDTDFLIDAGGEAAVRPEAGQTTAGLTWRAVRVGDAGAIDLNRHVQRHSWAVVYVHCTLTHPTGGWAFLRMRHDDAAEAWLNGQRLGQWGLSDHALPVELKAGDNALTVKVVQYGGGWSLALALDPPVRVSTPDVTPNGDGVNDGVYAWPAIADPQSVVAVDDRGELVGRLALRDGRFGLDRGYYWNARIGPNQPAAPGRYLLTARYADGTELTGEVTVHRADPLAKREYRVLKEFFPLGVFYDGNHMHRREVFRAECEDIAAHGLNTISFVNTWLGRDRLGTPDGGNWAMEEMKRAGLKAVWPIQHHNAFMESNAPVSELPARKAFAPIVAEARKYDALAAYYLWDEPGNHLAHRLRVASRVVEDLDPRRPPTACLIGTDRIKNVGRAMEAPIMCIDPYAVSYGSELGDFRMSGFGYRTLDMGDYIDLAVDAARPGANLWVIVQTHNFQTQLRQPTPAEVRAMSWISLARGAKGLIWFVYHTDQGWTGLVDADRKPTPRYQAAAEVARTVAPMADTLLALERADTPAARVASERAEVRTFRHGRTGRRFLICVNRDVTRKRPIHLKGIVNARSARDLARGRSLPIRAGQLTVTLPPGGGAVLALED